jgi:hypothetical protein
MQVAVIILGAVATLGFVVCGNVYGHNKVVAIWFLFCPSAIVLVIAGCLQWHLLILHPATPETEIHGLLIPSNEPMPDNPCREIPANALAIFLGRCAAFSSDPFHVVLRIQGENVLSFSRVNNRIAVNAKVYSRDGRIVAEIRDNEFFINPNNYFRRERRDAHSLVVLDQNGHNVLDVSFLNPRAIRFSGIFNHPERPVVISPDAGLFKNSICFGECKVDVALT